MDPVEPSDVPAGLTAGRLEGVPFPNLLRALCRSGKTGVLRVDTTCRSWLYLDRGRVVFAASDDPDRRIGALLLRQGAIQLADLRAALERQGSSAGTRLGTLLVDVGCIDEAELVEALRAQYRDIVADLFALESGEYSFGEGRLPTTESITLAESTEALILTGIRGVRSFARIRGAVGGPGVLYALAADWRERVAGLGFDANEEQILERLERGEESVEYLCREVLSSNFETYQAVWSLSVLGAVRRVPTGAETGDDAAFQRPEPDEGFVEFLLRLCRAGATGVIYASRGAVERTFHLREGRCIFATSSDPDDGLVTYLMRRGVIALRDREEVVHRLLTNKRVGTILLEMGVIDEDDLRDAVRQQLGEIVWSTVCQDGGDYTFLGGSLPSLEEITLDLNIDALIAEGLRRVTSWSRVRRGSGGLQSRLALTPSYLDVLDAMGAGVEEWDIAAALREPRTPIEVCSLVGLGDFRVCQLLWCLRVLGAVQVVEAVEETVDVDPDVASRELEPRPIEIPLEDLDVPTEVPVETVLAVERHGPALPLLMQPGWHRPNVSIDAVDEMDIARPIDVIDDSSRGTAAPDVDVEAVEATVETPEPEPAPEVEAEIEVDAVAEAEPGVEVEVEVELPAEAEEPPSIWEMERSTRTQRISREEVEFALSGPVPGPPGDPAEVACTVDDDAERPAEIEASFDDDDDEDDGDEVAVSASIPVFEQDDEPHVEAADAQDEDAEDDAFEPRPEEPWQPPADLDVAISRFNAAQRLVYRTARVEIGAGAANFIRACCAGDTGHDAIGESELLGDGAWDIDGLRQAAIACRLEEPWGEYQRLIHVELDRLRDVIGPDRAEALIRKIDQVAEA